MSESTPARRSDGTGLGVRKLPGGRVTFLFTDVEGSTRLLHELGVDAYAACLAVHRRAIRNACAEHGGVEVDTQGDAFFVAFSDAEQAVRAAGAITTSLDAGPMRVRIGLHTGHPLLSTEGYVGEDVHLGARIAAAGHGGQVLMSRSTCDAIDQERVVADLGEHRLKDIADAVAIFQLGTDPFPPLKTISNTNLPRPTDSFLGREGEVEDIAARVRSGRRLVTLVGPGGTGKTRLAIETAASLLSDFTAGVFWVDLSTVRDPAAVPAAVASTFATEQDVALVIGEREMLLVLDNLEQVIDAAPWVGSLVAACPNLAVIVTSRERLRVRGESLVDVPPLANDVAGQLFADRSGMRRTPDVDELCARLEDIPLAVELAAARAASLSPRQILDRLGQRLDLLKGGRDADPRQRTLRATIEWSHGLLGSEEQRLFRRLAVFAGGTTLEGVEAACDGDLDTIESLIDKSLVRFVHGRYTMLETVREYAEERLDAVGEADGLRDRHAVFVRDLMAVQIPLLAASGEQELGRSVAAEFANVQAAFAWLETSGQASRAVRLLDTVWWFLGLYISQVRVGIAMCESVLAMLDLTDADRATAWHREGNFAIQLAEPDRARRAWSAAAELFHRMGDAAREADLVENLALIEVDPAEAIRLLEHAIAIAPARDERRAIGTRWNLAGLKIRAGDSEAAHVMYAEVFEWAERTGDYQFMAAAERELADAALHRGDATEALERATRSRDLGASRGHGLMIALAELVRCRAAIRLGRRDDAMRALVEALDLVRVGDMEADDEIAAAVIMTAVEVLAVLGDVDLAGRLEAARRRITEGGWGQLGDVDQAHIEWLASTGVTHIGEPEMDAPSAFALIRESLQRHRAGG